MLIKAFKRVFRNFTYITIAVVTAIVIFLFSVYLPNLELIQLTFSSDNIGFFYKLHFMLLLLGGISTNTNFLGAFNIITLSVLFGINIAMLVFMIRKNRAALKTGSAASAGGVFSGVLGIGCSACGSLILTPLLAAFGAAGFLTLLPLRGGEFGLLGILLVLISVRILAKKINDPGVCPAPFINR